MHRRRSRRWWHICAARVCVCGLPWPCVDAALEQVGKQYPQPPTWTSWSTAAYPQSGRAGMLTPGQAHRANTAGRHGS